MELTEKDIQCLIDSFDDLIRGNFSAASYSKEQFLINKKHIIDKYVAFINKQEIEVRDRYLSNLREQQSHYKEESKSNPLVFDALTVWKTVGVSNKICVITDSGDLKRIDDKLPDNIDYGDGEDLPEADF